MSEWMILHQVLIKTQIIYPVIAGIIAFSIFETVIEYRIRKENKNEQC